MTTTATQLHPDEHLTGRKPIDEADARTSPRPQQARPSSPRGARGFVRQLTRATLAKARIDGVSSAIRDAIATESLLRAFRSHLLATPPQARVESHNVGLIVIELMILRESRLTRGAPSVG